MHAIIICIFIIISTLYAQLFMTEIYERIGNLLIREGGMRYAILW